MTPVTHPAPAHGPTRRVTASDRLEADKAKYVKSPQVIHRRQNPVINANFTPSLSRKLSTSPCSSHSQTEHLFTRHFDHVTHHNDETDYCSYQSHAAISSPFSPNQRSEPKTAFSPRSSLSPGMLRRKPNLSQSEMKKGQSLTPNNKYPKSQGFLTCQHGSDPPPATGNPTTNPHCLRRLSGRRLNRPDSLIIYRQRRDVALTSKENNNEAGLVIRLLQGTPLLRRSARFSQDAPQACNQEVPVSPRLQQRKEVTGMCQTTGYSSSNKEEVSFNEQLTLSSSDVQHFFESCGLEGSLLNLLKNYQRGEDTPMGSLESMDRVSCGITVAGEEKEEKDPVSIIERNARVIKWIYSCHRARTISGHGDKQVSRESTV
ncbi:protein FAM110D [Pseudophryne corroboree]|uniref:protein FAM110D n=1 Tax=Pseudophryne corroboree TaxID=495146 RepID=UPI003082152B